MKYSIVVPVYNVSDCLSRCVDSLLAQEGPEHEILLVDDGSTDGESGPLCDAYAARFPSLIRVIHKPNGGLGDARNVGLEAAAGEYVLFVDSDDYLAPQALRRLDGVVEQFHCDVVSFCFVTVTDGKEVLHQEPQLPQNRPLTLADTPALLQAAPNAWNRLWRRSLFLNSGIRYPSRVWYEDIRTTGKLFALANSIVAIPDGLYYYVLRQGSIMQNASVQRNLEIIDAFEDLLGWYRQQGLFDRFQQQLCALTVRHVLIFACVRVCRVDPKSPVLQRVHQYALSQFPRWRDTPQLKALPPLHRLALSLSAGKHYRLLRALFALKDRL